jgi:hypothetical protein
MLKKGKGKQIRQRGNSYERDIAQEFRELGWKDCVTSRAESRNQDAKKIDLVFTNPFSVQIKCKNNYGNPLPVLAEMPKDSNYNIVINKIVHKGEFVTMSKKDFYEIISMLKSNKII